MSGNAVDTHLIVLWIRGHRYVFVFRDDQRDELQRTLGRFATNPELDFNWYDAAVISRRARDTSGDLRSRARTED